MSEIDNLLKEEDLKNHDESSDLVENPEGMTPSPDSKDSDSEPDQLDSQGEEQIEEGILKGTRFYDIPDYTLKKNIFERHKFLEEALLTPDLIKFFDQICDDVNARGENYFNLQNYLASFQSTHISKETMQKNFYLMVDLLSAKTVSLVEVAERNQEDQPLTIRLLEKKKFDLHLFHRFNDYLIKVYDPTERYRKPIFYNLSVIAEKLKVTRLELDHLCIPMELKNINPYEFNHISERTHSGKVAVIIDLGNDEFGEAVIPLYLADNLLSYLTSQLLEYMEELGNEKVSSLVKKKLQENHIEYLGVKKLLNKPDPSNNNLGVFIRIFYTVTSQIYHKDYGATNKKMKETESYMIISLIARQFILNSKMMSGSKKGDIPTDDKESLAVKVLISNEKLLSDNIVRIPMSMITIENKFKEIKGSQSAQFDSKEWVETFQKFNTGNDTIKEVLIMRLGEVNYYIHRATIVLLFLGLLNAEQKKLYDRDEQAKNNNGNLPKNLTKWENYVERSVSKFLVAIHQCLISCLMTMKPKGFTGNQIEYWLSRFFFSLEEIKKYDLTQTELNMSENDKKKILKKTIDILIGEQENFLPLTSLFDFPYRKSKKNKESQIIHLIINAFKRIFSWILIDADSFKSKKNSKFSDSRELTRAKARALNFGEEDKSLSQIYHKKDKTGGLMLVKKMEKRFPQLKNLNQLRQMIEDEHDNWNLKIGEKREDNKKTIDGIINTFIIRLDIKKFIEEDFDITYEILAKNNPVLKKIKNQAALKNYMLYRTLLEKHRQLKRSRGV